MPHLRSYLLSVKLFYSNVISVQFYLLIDITSTNILQLAEYQVNSLLHFKHPNRLWKWGAIIFLFSEERKRINKRT